MEKRILSLLVVLAMVMAFVVLPAENHAAAAQEESVIPEICPCGCGVALDQLEWRPWDPNNTSVNPSGHYYLEDHYVQEEQFGISTEKRIVLDLRGNELSTKEYGRLFLCNGFLAVLDTVGGGRMSAKTAGNGFGGLLLMQTTGSCFELYGGTVTMDDDNKGSRRGGLISVGTGCTFNMYGGMLLGGSSQGTQNEEGGCVASYYSSGVICILGGSVVGGYSPTHGGNIYSKGTTILKNCTITGGVAGSYGGNIYQSGGSTEPEKWGDSCLIVFPDGQTMLIDSGVTQYGPILVENLRRMGVTKLDHLVITHPHSDHQNGIFSTKNRAAGGVLDTFPIGQVYHRGGYDSKNMESSQLVATVCAERNLPLQTLDIGDSFQIGEVSVRVLWPQEGTADKDITGVNAAATNDTSVVLRFDYKEHSSLFTGDIYVESEARVMAANDAALLDADLLKLPHHGNTVTSNSEEFLAAVSPQIAVATGFEIMDARSLSRFTAVGATVLNDRIYGYVHVATDGNEMTYETSREASLLE